MVCMGNMYVLAKKVQWWTIPRCVRLHEVLRFVVSWELSHIRVMESPYMYFWGDFWYPFVFLNRGIYKNPLGLGRRVMNKFIGPRNIEQMGQILLPSRRKQLFFLEWFSRPLLLIYLVNMCAKWCELWVSTQAISINKLRATQP